VSQEQVVAIAQDALMTTLIVSAPILLVTLAIGVVISLVQAMTQINEVTLTYVPKILAVFGVFAVAGPWMMSEVTGMTTRLLTNLPQYIR
jgi:flagellar biosynthetic protein FliQ